MEVSMKENINMVNRMEKDLWPVMIIKLFMMGIGLMEKEKELEN